MINFHGLQVEAKDKDLEVVGISGGLYHSMEQWLQTREAEI